MSDEQQDKCGYKIEVGHGHLTCNQPPQHDGWHSNGLGAKWSTHELDKKK